MGSWFHSIDHSLVVKGKKECSKMPVRQKGSRYRGRVASCAGGCWVEEHLCWYIDKAMDDSEDHDYLCVGASFCKGLPSRSATIWLVLLEVW